MSWHPRLVLFFALAPCVACSAPLHEGLSAPVRHPDGSHRHAFVAALREENVPRALTRVAVTPAPPRTVVVRRGDTLYSLARSHGVTVQELASLNGLARPQDLQAGSQLRLPQLQAPAAQTLAEGDPSAPAADSGLAAGADATPTAAGTQEGAASALDPASMSPAQIRVAELAGHPVGSASESVAGQGPVGGGLNKAASLQWPIPGSITSQFGNRSGRPHDGIDIGARPGTEVRAAADGDVVFADAHGGYGNVVILRHGHGLLTIYAHHERNLVRKGQRVHAGETIARVGITGRSRGPHLHFEVRQGTRPQNPLHYLPRSGG